MVARPARGDRAHRRALPLHDHGLRADRVRGASRWADRPTPRPGGGGRGAGRPLDRHDRRGDAGGLRHLLRLPATPREWQWITPGAVVFLLGFAGSSAAFSYYAGEFASYDKTYGSLGAVIILLFWMYILAFFLLLGGELNALLEARIRAAEQRTKAPPAAPP
ncbi:MAG TPA: YihY/virulence factor BrkB family protein, partial [Candidatus Binatus sp.]|nr:YihY/virulence factor BrkB family protein [Candidatus Binatus sp.]